MSKKNLTIEKATSKIAKLNRKISEADKTIRLIGGTVVRGNAISDLDNNRLLYEIAMQESMVKTMKEILSHKDENEMIDVYREAFGNNNIQELLREMKTTISLRIKRKEMYSRIKALENYINALPVDVKSAFKLTQAENNVHPEDVEDES